MSIHNNSYGSFHVITYCLNLIRFSNHLYGNYSEYSLPSVSFFQPIQYSYIIHLAWIYIFIFLSFKLLPLRFWSLSNWCSFMRTVNITHLGIAVSY